MNAMEQYMMQRELDEARAQLAQIRAVLSGYPDSDLIDLAKQHAHQVAIFAALVESGAVTQEQCVAGGRGLE
jgi:predicted ATP-dependent serine protease